MAKIQVFRGYNSQFYYRLRADNEEIVLSSEGYLTRQGCFGGVSSLRTNAPLDSRYDRYDAPLSYRFNLKGANGEVIGRSEVYTTVTSREQGISVVKRIAPSAILEDLT